MPCTKLNRQCQFRQCHASENILFLFLRCLFIFKGAMSYLKFRFSVNDNDFGALKKCPHADNPNICGPDKKSHMPHIIIQQYVNE